MVGMEYLRSFLGSAPGEAYTAKSTGLHRATATGSPNSNNFASANSLFDLLTPPTWVSTFVYALLHDYLYITLLLTIPTLYYLTQSQSASITHSTSTAAGDEQAFRLAWTAADKFQSLLGLVEQYLYGAIPWGPWDASSIRDQWPKNEKTHFKRMVRAGIIPLRIAKGGMRTYQRRGWGVQGWKIVFPEWVQSSGRAYFDLVVLYPYGNARNPLPAYDEARQELMLELSEHQNFSVTASLWESGSHQSTVVNTVEPSREFLEGGTTSSWWGLLPFKSDRVLQKRYGHTLALRDLVKVPNRDMPLVARHPYALVHVEALDFEPARLDDVVHKMMKRAGIKDLWAEDEMSRQLAQVYDDIGLSWESPVQSESVEDVFCY